MERLKEDNIFIILLAGMPGFALVLDSVPKYDGEKKVIEIKLGFLDSVGCGSSIDRALDSC